MFRHACTTLLLLAPASSALACSECVDGAVYGYVPFARYVPFIFLGWYLLFAVAWLAVRKNLSHHSLARPHKGFFWHCLVAMAFALACGVCLSFYVPVVLFSTIWIFRLLQGTRAFYHHARHGVWAERILGAVDAAALVCLAVAIIGGYTTAFSISNMVNTLGSNYRTAISWDMIPRLIEAGPEAVPALIARADSLMAQGQFTPIPLYVETLAKIGSPAAADYFPVLLNRYLAAEAPGPADLLFVAASYVRCAGKAAIPALQKAYDRIPWTRPSEKSALLDALVYTGDRVAILYVLDRMTLWLEHGGYTIPMDALIFEDDPALLRQLPMPELRLSRHEGFFSPLNERYQTYETLAGRTPAGGPALRSEWAEHKDNIRARWERALEGPNCKSE